MKRSNMIEVIQRFFLAAALLASALLLAGCHLMVSEFRAKIVYVSDATGNTEIWTMRANGGGKRQLTYDGNTKRSPVWSPDGTKIAYVTGAQIWIMNWDGSDQHGLTSSGQAFHPAWSPDGTKLAFDWNGGIWIRNPSESSGIQISNGGYDGEPHWSPDGTRVAYLEFVAVNDYQIIIYNSVSGEKLTLTPSSPSSPFIWVSYDALSNSTSFNWSPDGSKIAFTSNTGYLKIWTVNADNSDSEQISQNDMIYNDSFPIWSPNGKRVAILRGTTADPYAIWIMDSSGNNLFELAFNTAGIDHPQWAPDGKKLILEAITSSPIVYIINADTTGLTQLTNTGDHCSMCTWTFK